jgi:CMP-N-acetylneuraminic acid synthetase
MRVFETNLENSGQYHKVVLLSDHEIELASVREAHQQDWKRLNRVFKSTSDKTIDQSIRIEELEHQVESLQCQLMATQEFSLREKSS